MNWSIERKLPLLVSALLLTVGVALVLVGYGEVRRAARQVADDRLTRADSAIANLFQTGQQRTRLITLAKDPAVAAFLASGGRGTRGRDSVLAALQRVVTDTSSQSTLQVLDSAGRELAHTGRFGPPAKPLTVPAGDSAVVGPLLRHDTTLYYSAAASVRREGRALGSIQQTARVNLNERTRRALTGLAGGDVAYLLGNAAGDPWTDFETIIPAPPASVRTSRTPVRYERGEMKRAVGTSVPGTPWSVIAELPSGRVLAPARAYLVTVTPIAAIIVLIGALIAWWGSHRLTTPLRQLTTAAEAIAEGNLEQQVDIRRGDELGRLAAAFNVMAEQVARSHHRLEGEVARRTAALEGTNAELESFSYSVSHDLRAPLRAIHGFARILLEDHKDKLDAEAQRLLGVVDQNTRRMGQLIDDLLAFSRLGRKEITAASVDMRELAQAVSEDARRAEAESRSGRSLDIRIDPLPRALGDRALLRQVMGNLVQNAVKFTRGKDRALIALGARPDGGQNVYYVKDNGAGFDPRYADKLFGVFQRLHRSEDFEGTGVGLAIVKRIVQRHGGRVWAEGNVDEGATFYFTLPAATAGSGAS